MERKVGAEAVRSARCTTDSTEWKSASVQTDAVETREDIHKHGTLWWPKEHNQGIVRAGEKERQYRDGKRRQRSITKSERDVLAAPKLGWLMG
jgi:hypothetical protein